MAMWRSLGVCMLLALLVPLSAAARTNAPDDGTLSVKNASGTLSLVARGSVIGSCDRCIVTIVDPQPDDGSGPIVSGEESSQDITDIKSRWAGQDVRFRLIGGFFRLYVTKSSGLDLTAVGKGSGWIRGAGTLNDGTYALNGGERRPLPDERRTFLLVDSAPDG
jgi:hypothetical protein